MARTGSEKEQRKLNNLPPSPVKSPTKIFQSRLAEVKDKKAKQRSSGGGKQGKKSADGKATTSGGSDDKDTAEKAKVHWSHPEYHYLTDRLLSRIEERSQYGVALGFKAHSKDVSSSGKKATVIHGELGETVLRNDPSGRWANADQKDLVNCIKNRISGLKQVYKRHLADLGETGAGLLLEDKEGEIEPGSALANKWDHISSKFPWFKRILAMSEGNPALNETASANSTSQLDLSVLTQTGPSTPSKAGESTIVPDGDESPDSHTGSPNLDKVQDSDDSRPSSPDQQPSKSISTTSTTKTIKQTSRKKTHLDHVKELHDHSSQARLALAERKGKDKLKREKVKQDALVEIRKLELEDQERQREHEREMARVQLEMARIQAGQTVGFPAAMNVGPSMYEIGGGTFTVSADDQPIFDPALEPSI
ncbi:hypothetical protein EIP86_006861 [Pleurotus ostreatoroseus]|nr:hypothetical protein EIP86_006861 [Pleurotus ostreatoroseus]